MGRHTSFFCRNAPHKILLYTGLAVCTHQCCIFDVKVISPLTPHLTDAEYSDRRTEAILRNASGKTL
jgi:hypothetical protein